MTEIVASTEFVKDLRRMKPADFIAKYKDDLRQGLTYIHAKHHLDEGDVDTLVLLDSLHVEFGKMEESARRDQRWEAVFGLIGSLAFVVWMIGFIFSWW